MESIGGHLRSERELRHLSLEELAQTTRIPLRMLQRIEADQFDELPGDVFARGFLRAYARAVAVDEERVIAAYDARGSKASVVAAPLTNVITAPERGRRFGIAIALVILLILFTLALSIVLRPRQREGAIELSFAPTTAVLARRG